MRSLLIVVFLFCSVRSFAQKDYFYAETLIENGQHAQAVRVLDHLIDSGAYTDRPRFAMMTLNLAGTSKLYLGDTLGAKKCFESVMACYDTLSGPRRSDDWNRREYYKAGEGLSRMYYGSGKYTAANSLLITIGYPGAYYSATGSDLILAQDSYCLFRTAIFQKLNLPDSAFHWICEMRESESRVVHKLDSLFENRTNTIHHVKFVNYIMKGTDPEIKSPGYLYFIAWTDHENTQHSIWLVNPDQGAIRIAGESTKNVQNDQNFPANCYDMSLSPDEKYLAVTCYTEGSNFIDIYSFPELLNERRCVEKQSILAYPAEVVVKGWENSMLIVESEADLTRLNRKERLSPTDYPKEGDVVKTFLFDLESGKFEKK